MLVKVRQGISKEITSLMYVAVLSRYFVQADVYEPARK